MENEIDAKLVAFSKLGVNTHSKNVTPDEVPLLDEEHVFENMALEIETLLSKVSNSLVSYILYTVVYYSKYFIFSYLLLTKK